MARLSNNQSNELGWWEELVRKLRRLEKARGMYRLHAEFWRGVGVSVTVSGISGGAEARYTSYLAPYALRVIWGSGYGPHPRKSFGATRQLLRHVITEVEEAVVWAERERERWEEIEDEQLTRLCPCGHTPAEHYQGDGLCEIFGCRCPYFGAELYIWETHTITYADGDLGGLVTVE